MKRLGMPNDTLTRLAWRLVPSSCPRTPERDTVGTTATSTATTMWDALHRMRFVTTDAGRYSVVPLSYTSSKTDPFGGATNAESDLQAL